MGTKPVTVVVTNVDEPGVVTLSARQPMAGVTLTATITDPDGATSNPEWQWQKGSSNIPNADRETYTDGGLGQRLLSDGRRLHTRTRRAAGIQEGKDVRSDYVVLRAASGNNSP